jgi:hypothetical protein
MSLIMIEKEKDNEFNCHYRRDIHLFLAQTKPFESVEDGSIQEKSTIYFMYSFVSVVYLLHN